MNENHKKVGVVVIRHHQDHKTSDRSQKNNDSFHRISVKISNKLGSSIAFFIALLVIVVWGLSGPIFHFSDTWQLVINTGTTIVTFLMVFVIQNTQNRDGKAMQLKLDELISANRQARNEFVDVEELSDNELDELQIQFQVLHNKLQARVSKN